MKSFLPNFQLCLLCVHRGKCTWTKIWEKCQVDNTIFKLDNIKVYQYNIFSTSHNRCTFLPLHDLSRKPIYKVCFKIQSTVDRHDFVSRSHHHSLSGAFPTLKACRTNTDKENVCQFIYAICTITHQRSWAFSSSVLWLHLNLNGIRDTTLSKRSLVPKHRLYVKAEKNVNRIMTSWIWTNALPILSFLNENYFTASIQSSELFVFCTTRNDLRKRRHECVLALDSYSEVEQMSQTISLSIKSVTISPIILL